MDKDDTINLLLDLLTKARRYVETCADDTLPNPADDLLQEIDKALDEIDA